MRDGRERWQGGGQGGGEEKRRKRRESQMAEKMVSASDQQRSSELGPRTCGRPGIGVKTEEEEVEGLGTLRDVLKVPVTSQPPQICFGAFYRHPEASEPDLIQLLITIELLIEETQALEAFKSAPPSIPVGSASCLSQTQVSMVMLSKHIERDCWGEGVTASGKAAGCVRKKRQRKEAPSDTSQAPCVAHARSVHPHVKTARSTPSDSGYRQGPGWGWGEPQSREGAETDGIRSVWGHRPPGLEHLQSATEQPITV